MKSIKIVSSVIMLCFCMSGCSQSINNSSLDTSSITTSVSVIPESDITNITHDSYYNETDTTLTSFDDNEESNTTMESISEHFDIEFDENGWPCGLCGERVQWILKSDGTLEITGEGEMFDFDWDYIEQTAFQPWKEYRDQISTVTIENGVSNIGKCAFRQCTELKKVVIAESVNSIGWCAFETCPNLEEITVDSNNQMFSSLDGVLFDKDMKSLIKYPGKKTDTYYDIPDTVVSIEMSCFEYCDLVQIHIPDNVESISSLSFAGLDKVYSVVLPNKLTVIENDLFNGGALEQVVIHENVHTIEEDAFGGCWDLTDIFFTGTQEQWERINISNTNDNIFSARIHCNYDLQNDGGVNWNYD